MERKVLATVGEKEITNYDVESALTSLDPYQAMHFGTEEGKKQLLEDLVNQELFYMEAKENEFCCVLSPDPTYSKHIYIYVYHVLSPLKHM